MKKQNKKKGNKFEEIIKKNINSGSLWFSPLDLQSQDYAIECKFTDKKGFRISTQLLEKIWGQALSINKLPLLILGIRRNEKDMFVLNCNITTKGI